MGAGPAPHFHLRDPGMQAGDLTKTEGSVAVSVTSGGSSDRSLHSQRGGERVSTETEEEKKVREEGRGFVGMYGGVV